MNSGRRFVSHFPEQKAVARSFAEKRVNGAQSVRKCTVLSSFGATVWKNPRTPRNRANWQEMVLVGRRRRRGFGNICRDRGQTKFDDSGPPSEPGGETAAGIATAQIADFDSSAVGRCDGLSGDGVKRPCVSRCYVTPRGKSLGGCEMK